MYFLVDVGLFAVCKLLGEYEGIVFKLLTLGCSVILHIVRAVGTFILLQRFVNRLQKNRIIDFFRMHSMVIYLVHQQLIYFSIGWFNGVVLPVILILINFVFSLTVSTIFSVLMYKTKATRFLVGCKLNMKKERKRIMLPINNHLVNKTILVTGAAGFIGSNLVLELIRTQSPCTIIGIDNMNDYYDVSIKEYRLQQIESVVKDSDSTWTFIKGSIADRTLIDDIFATHKPAVVVNLAAQAGVRYSITNPDVYIESNLIGFYNILEACRHSYDNGETGVEHLVYASSSSVYGSNKKVPYSTDDKVDNPVSLYAATKKSNELMAHAYSKLYNIPSTGLRFFTVYGPAGRPDMAYFGFTNKLVNNETIKIFNYGNCKRDFTYVDDIVEGVKRVMMSPPEKKNGDDGLPIPPYKIYNIGNNNPENLLDFVQILSEELIRAGVLPQDYDFDAHKELVPMQPGDVPVTYADTSALETDFGFKPSTSLRDGLRKFAEWYKNFYKI